MSNTLREFVATLTPDELWGVHESYTEFEDKDSIGQAPCRVLAMHYLQEQGMPTTTL